MKNPLVSIIIPTRNRRKLCEFAIKSCLNQSYSNLQIVVHENSTDDDKNFKHFKKKFSDPRLKIVRAKSDLSMNKNWNAASKFIKGEYFVRLDDDNIFFKDFIKFSIESILKHKLDFFVTYPVTTFNKKSPKIFFKPTEEINILNYKQIIFLNYFTITDSNYAVYNTRKVKSILDDFYKTSLPDRYMDYQIVKKIKSKKFRYGISSKVLSTSRYDYRDSEYKLHGNIKYHDFNEYIKNDSILDTLCHNNFILNRYITLSNTLNNSSTPKYIRKYINKFITPFNEYNMMGYRGSIFECGYLKNFKQIIIFNLYYFRSISFFTKNFNKFFEYRSSCFNIVLYTLQYVKIMFRSIMNKLIKNNSSDIDTSKLEKILKKIINQKNSGNELKLFDKLGFFGKLRKVLSEDDLSNFLKKII